MRPLPWQNIDVLGPAGSINSSIRDMAKWIVFQLNNGVFAETRLISENNMREMHAPQIVVSSDDEIPKLIFPDSAQLSYGFGWFVEDYRGHHLILHAGEYIGGFATMVAFNSRTEYRLHRLDKSWRFLSASSELHDRRLSSAIANH